MRDRLTRPGWWLVMLAAVLGLCSCTTVVQGAGRVASGAATVRPTPTASPGVAVTPSALRRIVRSTPIGDPGIADICAAIPYQTWNPVGVAAIPYSRRYPPDCDLSLITSPRGDEQLEIAAYVEPLGVASTKGGVGRSESGQRVLAYAYVARTQQCERLLIEPGFEVNVRTYPGDGGSAGAGRHYACRAANAMVRALATSISDRTIAPFDLASPSITRFDVCKVALGAGFESLPLLSGASIDDDSFGMGCGVDARQMYLTVRVALEPDLPAQDYRTVTAGRHRLRTPVDSDPKNCVFLSQQGQAINGRHELVQVTAHAYGSTLPGGACATTQSALTRYLDTAGLT